MRRYEDKPNYAQYRMFGKKPEIPAIVINYAHYFMNVAYIRPSTPALPEIEKNISFFSRSHIELPPYDKSFRNLPDDLESDSVSNEANIKLSQ